MHTHTRTVLLGIIALVMLLTSTLTLRADPPRYFEVDQPAQQWHDKLVPIVTASANRLRVSDPAQALVLTHRLDAEHALSVIALDDKGQPIEGERYDTTLPTPDGLKGHQLEILDVVTHPDKPLLYIWQDVARVEDNNPSEKAVYAHLDHLLVYEITGDRQLKLLQQVGRGNMYDYRAGGGKMALDWTHRRLYVPNTFGREPDGQRRRQAGWLPLDETGRVITTEDDAGERIAQLAGQPGPWDSNERIWPDEYLPVPGTDQRVILANGDDLLAWDMTYYRYRFGSYGLSGSEPGDGSVNLSLHPELPIVYATFGNGRRVFRIRHANGLPTMMPQRMTIKSVKLRGRPLITADGQTLVIAGDRERIYFITLDENGWLTGEVKMARLSGGYQRRSAMAYSPKFDLFYAQSEKPVPEDHLQASE